MSPSKEENVHVHQYVRKKEKDSKGRTYFRCFDKFCYHIALRADLIGKASICTICGEEFILTGESLRRSKPRCLACTDSAAGRLQRQVKDLAQVVMVAARNEDENRRQEILDKVFGGSTELSNSLPVRNRAAEESETTDETDDNDFEELDKYIEGEENDERTDIGS